jgi:hypothetical protein
MRKLLLLATTIFLAPAFAYAGQEKMPLPERVLTAKTIYIDNRSGQADIGDKAYDELRKWGRLQVVGSAEKADVVLLLSTTEYVQGYRLDSRSDTTGTINSSGQLTAQTDGDATVRAVVSGMTYITLIDQKSGDSLWSNSRAWAADKGLIGCAVFRGCKSATRGLVQDLRDRVNRQEGNLGHH